LEPESFQSLPALISVIGRRGRTGLHNLGNSCYMSSSLQCISHITPLRSYFLSDRYLSDVNEKSRDGTGGHLCKEIASLFRDLWLENGSKTATSPLGIKRVLGKLNADYAGFAQQDAHEVVGLIFDKLHEGER
jgi:ubiquitin C-terminal hydrolase